MLSYSVLNATQERGFHYDYLHKYSTMIHIFNALFINAGFMNLFCSCEILEITLVKRKSLVFQKLIQLTFFLNSGIDVTPLLSSPL